jgi:hypothetical protein
MGRYCWIITAALTALTLCCALAPAAGAKNNSTLLSGYGGPGQGNQAILGSTLIGGGGSAGGSSGASEEGTSSLAVPRGGSSGGGRPHHGPTAPSAQARTAPTATLPATAASSHVEAPALGLSGSDVAYMAVALLVLALTALLTVLLMRRSRPGGPAGER